MKTRLKVLIATMTMAATLPAAMPAQADPQDNPACKTKEPPHRMHGETGIPPEIPLPPFLRGIELSEDQQDAIFRIVHADAPAIREKTKSSRKAEEALRALSFAEKFDDHKAKELAETVADNMAVLALMRSRMESRIYALLTMQQRKQAEMSHPPAGLRPAGVHAPHERTLSRRT